MIEVAPSTFASFGHLHAGDPPKYTLRLTKSIWNKHGLVR